MTPRIPRRLAQKTITTIRERPCEITAMERRLCSGDVGVRWVSCGAGAGQACDCAGKELDTIICLAERQQVSTGAANAEQPCGRMLQGVHERKTLRQHMHRTGQDMSCGTGVCVLNQIQTGLVFIYEENDAPSSRAVFDPKRTGPARPTACGTESGRVVRQYRH